MSQCIVCHGQRLDEELVDKVFDTGGSYVMVTGIPATVFQSGINGKGASVGARPAQGVPVKSVSMKVYEFPWRAHL